MKFVVCQYFIDQNLFKTNSWAVGTFRALSWYKQFFLYRLTLKLPELVTPIYLRYSKRAEWTEHSGTKWTEIFLPTKISREKKYKPERVKLKVTKTLVTGTSFLRGGQKILKQKFIALLNCGITIMATSGKNPQITFNHQIFRLPQIDYVHHVAIKKFYRKIERVNYLFNFKLRIAMFFWMI